MNLLHTADWHLGQTFYQYDRYHEHEYFLNWLLQTIENQKIDVLLISGDVFDTANPAVESLRLFYHFLHRAITRFPQLQIIATAGNHDSPVRLEMPQPLLEDTRVHLIGHVRRNLQKQIDYDSLIIPLYKGDTIAAYCLAVPFLRLGDYPKNEEQTPNYAEGITLFYNQITQRALAIAQGKPLIAMGHLHATGAEVSDDDTAERPIIGGIEGVQATAFPTQLQYVALGHIHKAQALGGKEYIRYSGSPLPLSFAERNYNHQVVCIQLIENKIQHIQPLVVPLHTPLLSVPAQHQSPEKVLQALQALPESAVTNSEPLPFLEVKVLLSEPSPELKSEILKAIGNKHVRLARIDVRLQQGENDSETPLQSELALNDLQPIDVLKQIYEKKFHTPLPERYEALFEEALALVLSS